MTRWTNRELEIIKANRTLGSKAIAEIISNEVGTSRTYRAVRAYAMRNGIHIENTGRFKPVLGKWQCRNGKWRTRVNGKVVTLGREGLNENEVLLQDGNVVDRCELLQLNKLNYTDSDDSIKPSIMAVVRLENQVRKLTTHQHG